MKAFGLGLLAAAGLASGFAFGAAPPDVGGALEGPVPALYPVQHGEAPGQPGCVPALIARSAADTNAPEGEWTPQDQWPQIEVYPGSIENWRAYWMKYVPVRPMVDANSLLKKWDAPRLPGAESTKAETFSAPLYWVPRHAAPRPTGLTNAPVPVVRCGVRAPVFTLDLGELPEGLYLVRVIGAIESRNIAPRRAPLYAAMTINDGNDGSESRYRLRLGCVDEFYSVAEFYFHAPVKRAYTARLWVDEGSAIDLLVHRIDLHDALAGAVRRPVKTRMTLTTPEARDRLRLGKGAAAPAAAIADLAARFAKDASLWNALPPLNAQIGGIYGLNRGYANTVAFGANGLSLAQLEAEHGPWKIPKGADTPVLLTNDALKLSYTTADLAALKPLPDPYPVKDAGAGVVTLAGPGVPTQQEFTVVADAAAGRYNRYFIDMEAKARKYHLEGNLDSGWDAALQLCRAAWQYPALDGAQTLGALVTDPGGFEREMRCRRRDPSIKIGTGNGFGYDDFITVYDEVFEVIRGNPDFARSLSRFVPWVKTPEDATRLVDVYLVQVMAKQILRYNYLYDNAPTLIAGPAAVLGDRSVTDPWLAWLFAKAYIYPNPPAGMGEVISTGNSREGVGYIGSWTYCVGEQAARPGQALEAYLQSGGNPQYDLTNPRLFPKVSEAAYFLAIRSRLAGLHFPRVGDVCGPDKGVGAAYADTMALARSGWSWTHDPAFAWIVKNVLGRQGESDADWAAIEQAAAKKTRAPWLENRSRVLPNWFGALETGTEHDDSRFRRSVMLRIGQGYGHAHNDTLDLQLTAHGLPMTIDGGQRPSYGKPGDAVTRIHNLVEVDGKDWSGHAWIRSLVDAAGARYMQAEAVPPATHPDVKSYRRQVALVDVDEGRGARPLSPAELKPDAPLDKDVTTPDSYVFDVVRVSGGRSHTYCFHGPLEDSLEVNIANRKPYEELPAADQETVSPFRNAPIAGYPILPQRFGGDAPDTLEATWRMAVEIPGNGFGEKEMAPSLWSAAVPRKYTRLHLLGAAGARAMTGWAWCRQWSYGYNTLMTQRRSETNADAVFTALIEPYAGAPFIASRRLLAVRANEEDASRAVAVEVVTTNGHADVVFADGRPDRVRSFAGPGGAFRMAGEFAYYSMDAAGLRQATLAAGTLLEGPGVLIEAAARERTGTVAAVDYPGRRFTIGGSWPADLPGVSRAVEIGVPGRMTTYMVTRAVNDAGQTAFATDGGADFYLSGVKAVDAAAREVRCGLGLPPRTGEPNLGFDRKLVVSNGEGSRFWRADYLGQRPGEKQYTFRLDGPVAEADFGKGGSLRVWEYGVGDAVRQATGVTLRRGPDGVYEISGDVDVKIKMGNTTRFVPAEEMLKGNGRVRLAP